MQQIWIRKNGAPSTLRLEEAPDPKELQDHELLVEVHYSGINFADVIMRQGLYPDAPPKPFVPGYEVSGVVARVGKSVTRFKAGDEVIAGCLFRGYSSRVIAPEDLVFPKPAHLTLAEAGGVAVNWITAHAALRDMGRVRAGDLVLVDAATGGVGTIALQMLRHTGARTIGLTSSAAKMDYIRSLGAEPMTHDEFEKSKLRDFDLILNSQGGKTVRPHYDRLGMTGRVVVFGMSSGISAGKRNLLGFAKAALQMPRFSLISMFNVNRGVYALNALTLLGDAKYRTSLSQKWEEVARLKLQPHIDQVFPAAKAAEAHAHLESRRARGKLVLSWR